jgi:adenine-specific DNA-methyltransferase
MVEENRIWFGKDGNNIPAIKRFLSEVKDGMTAMTLWKYTEVGHNQDATREVTAFNPQDPFSTPKPERLIERILTLGSNEGDLVLDSFLGSGTTAAVAHKMGRRWIGIELGDHCYTHCLPRLKAVVDGEQGGVSKSVNWQGGGGFKFYELAPTLIVKDKHGNPIIDTEKYNPEMLAAAVAKLNGFAYAPDPEVFWKQGKNVENSYIYVTTQYLTARELDDIARDLPDYEKLLICAPAFDIGLGKRYENIDVRKIPQSVLNKCEFGADNYNLNIVNPPELDEEEWDDAEQ